MKKTFTAIVALILTAFAFTLTACDKEEKNNQNQNPGTNPQIETAIIGSWNQSQSLFILSQGGITDTTSMLEDGETSEITFNPDKTYSSIYHSLDGDSEDQGTWSVLDGRLVMTSSNELDFGDMTYDVAIIDPRHLTLSYHDSGVDEDGPYSISILISLEKVD